MKLTPSNKSNEIDFKKFKNYAIEQLKLFNNVGIAISIFSNDKILFEEGIGYKDNLKKLPFTSRTLFPIGSHTKSITATAMAMLIDEGLTDWEKPIREYIPEFKLKDPLASERATIKDVMSHTTGLPHHQFAFMNSEWNYKDIFKRLPYLDPLFDFRAKHKYSNLNYFIVTKIIEELSGKTYFSFVKDRIFSPLGMKNTNFSINETYKLSDYTKGYKESENGFIEEEYIDLQYISAGAGSVNSCLEDMSKWIQFHLNKGKVNGKELISEKTLSNLYIQQKLDFNPFVAIISEKNYFTNYGFALGWWNLDYRGTKIIQHYGTGPGLLFNGGFLPYNNIGFVIFSNTSGSDIPFYLNLYIADQVLGLEPFDMGARLKKFNDMQQATIAE